jgi:hypothetical protein
MPFGHHLRACAWCGHRGVDVAMAYWQPMCSDCKQAVYYLQEPHRAELLRRAPGLARRLAEFPASGR